MSLLVSLRGGAFEVKDTLGPPQRVNIKAPLDKAIFLGGNPRENSHADRIVSVQRNRGALH
jgi:hypothetical protein